MGFEDLSHGFRRDWGISMRKQNKMESAFWFQRCNTISQNESSVPRVVNVANKWFLLCFQSPSTSLIPLYVCHFILISYSPSNHAIWTYIAHHLINANQHSQQKMNAESSQLQTRFNLCYFWFLQSEVMMYISKLVHCTRQK
jgi:hypothetical protein